MLSIFEIFQLLRYKHWAKNLIIYAALFFSFSFYLQAIERTTIAFLGFCLLSSSVYIINDTKDINADRNHPIKKKRLIASGRASITLALSIAISTFLLAMAAVIGLGGKLPLVFGVYFLLNLAYTFGLKNMPVIDVMIIALGFVIRVFAGAVAIKVPVSHWILLTTFFMALFMAFGKRKNEVYTLTESKKVSHRPSLAEYTNGFLDQMLSLTAAISVVFYVFYTIDPSTIARFHSSYIVYTTPIVVLGIFRYFFLLYNRNKGGDPVELFLKDYILAGSVIIWLLSFCLIHFYHA